MFRAVLAITLLALTAPIASADDGATVHHTAERSDNVVLTNLFMYAFGIFNFEYERAVGDRISVAGGVTAMYSNGTPFDSSLRSRGGGARGCSMTTPTTCSWRRCWKRRTAWRIRPACTPRS